MTYSRVISCGAMMHCVKGVEQAKRHVREDKCVKSFVTKT